MRESPKPTWFKRNRDEFDELAGGIYNNQNDKDLRIIINKRTYNLKNAKKFWKEVTTHKISKVEANKLYNKLIQKDIDVLKGKKSNDHRKYDILNILKNVNSVFTYDTYMHQKYVPGKAMFERSIAERNKLRKERLDEIKRKEKNINKDLFK